jgi:predicted DNA-binding mobile mystery protein A
MSDNNLMKTPSEQKVMTTQISRRLEELRSVQSRFSSVPSWIEYLRMGLGMSLSQLAARLGISQPGLSGSVKLEKEGRITVGKLKEIANAMDCDLVYGFVPRKKLEDLIFDQALNQTKRLIEAAETHMSLEDQKVTLNKDERLNDLVKDQIYSKHLWDK